MAIPINPVVSAIPPSGIRRFFDIAEQDKSVISMSVGEPDFAAPPTGKLDKPGVHEIDDKDMPETARLSVQKIREKLAGLNLPKSGDDSSDYGGLSPA